MIDKEELFNNKNFYKSFKNGRFNIFFKELYKKAVEQMIDAWLDSHLDNDKHEKSTTGNYRNGHNQQENKIVFWRV